MISADVPQFRNVDTHTHLLGEPVGDVGSLDVKTLDPETNRRIVLGCVYTGGKGDEWGLVASPSEPQTHRWRNPG